jgi:hypothetical protein
VIEQFLIIPREVVAAPVSTNSATLPAMTGPVT